MPIFCQFLGACSSNGRLDDTGQSSHLVHGWGRVDRLGNPIRDVSDVLLLSVREAPTIMMVRWIQGYSWTPCIRRDWHWECCMKKVMETRSLHCADINPQRQRMAWRGLGQKRLTGNMSHDYDCLYKVMRGENLFVYSLLPIFSVKGISMFSWSVCRDIQETSGKALHLAFDTTTTDCVQSKLRVKRHAARIR